MQNPRAYLGSRRGRPLVFKSRIWRVPTYRSTFRNISIESLPCPMDIPSPWQQTFNALLGFVSTPLPSAQGWPSHVSWYWQSHPPRGGSEVATHPGLSGSLKEKATVFHDPRTNPPRPKCRRGFRPQRMVCPGCVLCTQAERNRRNRDVRELSRKTQSGRSE